MVRDVTIGQYYPAESPVHELDPRTKLAWLLIYIVGLFLVRNPLWYVVFLGILLIAFKAANVPFSYFLKGLKPVIILLVFTFFFRMVATPGTVIAGWWIFQITPEGILKGTQLASRIALMIAAASLLSYTTTPKAMADGMAEAFAPLQKVGVPISDMSVMVMIAFRFIPVLLEEAATLMDAQASRGVEFQDCSIFRKCKNMLALTLPLFVNALERSADLAMAMESRGYNPEGPTSKMYPLKYGKNDRIAYIFAGCLLAASVVLRIVGLL